MLYNLKLQKWKNCAFSGAQCAPQKRFSEGPICMSGSRWMNFQKQLRKVGFDDYKKDKSKNAYPRLRTFRRKIWCVLSFQAIYIFFSNFASNDFSEKEGSCCLAPKIFLFNIKLLTYKFWEGGLSFKQGGILLISGLINLSIRVHFHL